MANTMKRNVKVFALPQRDMKCGRPTKAIKPYCGKHGRYPLIAEAADPPSSPLMNPKPRSAFHVFNVPAGILFPLFQPNLDRADGGLGFRWNVRESSLYSITRPRLLFSIGHFPLRFIESPSLFAFFRIVAGGC
jgi:hypothetical protein